MKFSEMKYQRPDVERYVQDYTVLIGRLQAASSYEQARAVFMEEQVFSTHINSMAQLAMIRYSINTKDEFYKAEQAWWDETIPQLEEYSQQWTLALLGSAFRKDFEAEFGDLLFRNAEISLRCFKPELIPLMQEENKLTNEYETLIASAQIPFEGGVYTISQLGPFKTDPDDERRLAAWKAEGAWYKEHRPDLDRIYGGLVDLRTRMGRLLGHADYLPLGYDRMDRNCYGPEDVDKFRKAVVKYLVPVADKIYRDQAARLGKSYPLSFADTALNFRSGNARPFGTPEQILAQGLEFYRSLSPETGEFFQYMLDNELLDVLSTEGKQAGGYCTEIMEYKSPFIFANFNGTQGDVEVVTHEAGHAFEVWMNRDRVPGEYLWPSMEACEVHSMSMEFFAWPWAEGFFGPDTRKYLYSHLAAALKFIPYGTMVDHFQHEMYSRPELTPEERHAVWKELLGIYMPWQKLDGDIPFYADGEGWQRQPHIYSSPLYYIDYCFAQTVSLEFWAMIQKDLPDAWQHYMAYTRQGGSADFRTLLANAGLASPFDEDCLKTVCSAAMAWLDEYDLSGIE